MFIEHLNEDVQVIVLVMKRERAEKRETGREGREKLFPDICHFSHISYKNTFKLSHDDNEPVRYIL